uniref:Uncharacterized protein n=1 Tax=Strongyloides venezuelensis TaxID=75913 RepID=A0A0K0G644_STRVS
MSRDGFDEMKIDKCKINIDAEFVFEKVSIIAVTGKGLYTISPSSINKISVRLFNTLRPIRTLYLVMSLTIQTQLRLAYVLSPILVHFIWLVVLQYQNQYYFANKTYSC